MQPLMDTHAPRDSARAVGAVLRGVTLGILAYFAISTVVAFVNPRAFVSVGVQFVTLLALVVVIVGVTIGALRMGRRAILSLSVTILLVSAVVIAMPVPSSFLDNELAIGAIIHTGARTFVAPAFAATLLALAIDRRSR